MVEVKTQEFCNATLICQFNTPVYCQWKRKDRIVDMGGRYNYDKGDRESVKDCSLDIKYITPMDFTYWLCEGYSTADTSKNPKYKTVYHISHDNKIDTKPSSPQHNFNIFDNDRCTRTSGSLYNPYLVLLSNNTSSLLNYNCKFNTHVDKCSWRSNNDSTLFDHEIEYGKNQGQDTDDCSMKTSPKFIKSRRVSRCEAKKELIKITPKQGTYVRLNCHSNKPVKCIWKHNMEDTTISGRYKYDFGNGLNSQDCSIRISTYTAASDMGLWICSKASAANTDGNEGHNVLSGYLLM